MDKHNEEKFVPQAVDAQIEQLLQQQQLRHNATTQDERLVQELQELCTDYASSHDRVWQRLATHLEQPATTPAISSLTPIPLHIKNHKRTQKGGTTLKKVAISRLGLIAACFIAAILVGSMFLVINATNSSMNTTIGHSIATPLPATPQKTLSNLNCNLYFDPAEHTLCTSQKEIPVQLTKTTPKGDQITIVTAYADYNRIFIRYQIRPGKILKAASKMLIMRITDATLQNTIKSDKLGGLSGGGSTDKQTLISDGMIDLDASNLPKNIKNLHLNLKFSLREMVLETSTKPHPPTFTAYPLKDPINIGPFDFTIPFNSTQKIVRVNKTVTVNGVAVTLDHLRITESQATLYTRGNEQAFLKQRPIQRLTKHLRINNKDELDYAWEQIFSTRSITTKDGFALDNIFFLNDAVLHKYGNWIFTLKLDGRTWTFPFTVPA